MKKSYLSPKVELRSSGIGGKGLFAREPIAKGELTVDYSTGPGTYLTTSEADRLYDQGNDYMLQVDDDRFFVATNESELEDADYVNHSCDPTCGIQGAVRIVALREIGKGEEITIDYAMCESSDYCFHCQCGGSRCRTVVTGEDWRKPELQERYAGHFSAYLERRLEELRVRRVRGRGPSSAKRLGRASRASGAQQASVSRVQTQGRTASRLRSKHASRSARGRTGR